MQELDKAQMGKRIRQIRLEAGLRQWELARLLGTTQSAVHKYEHGVVPEPKRLIELARVGNTSVEWVLTGTHWENGSREQRRLSPDLLRTAVLLREINERGTVDEALKIVRDAVDELAESQDGDNDNGPVGEALASVFREQSSQVLRVLETAWRIQQHVMRRVMNGAADRLAASPLLDEPETPEDGAR